MTAQLDHDDLWKISDLGEALAEEYGWSAMDMDLRAILAEDGLPCGDRAVRELGHRIVWLLS